MFPAALVEPSELIRQMVGETCAWPDLRCCGPELKVFLELCADSRWGDVFQAGRSLLDSPKQQQQRQAASHNSQPRAPLRKPRPSLPQEHLLKIITSDLIPTSLISTSSTRSSAGDSMESHTSELSAFPGTHMPHSMYIACFLLTYIPRDITAGAQASRPASCTLPRRSKRAA